ncbi:MAG: hypothetical protein CFE21_08145 [Bacteroidetes bacterium B1(2017)]|nr:MAG: hypothetical protein CFE21_08145 [Bacteroidetes bacterium B1(2017)]
MKNLKTIAILALVALFALPSCKKDLVNKYESAKTTPVASSAKSVKEIKAPASFSWNTTKTVGFDFKGIAGDARKSTLTLIAEDNTVLFRKLQNADENYTGTIELPTAASKVFVLYNGIKTEMPVSASNLNISLK